MHALEAISCSAPSRDVASWRACSAPTVILLDAPEHTARSAPGAELAGERPFITRPNSIWAQAVPIVGCELGLLEAIPFLYFH